MQNRVITLCYKKIIGKNTRGIWNEYVFQASFAEYKIQVQNYDQKKCYRSYSALLQAKPEASNLPFLLSGAAMPYLKQLNEFIPDVTNNLGKKTLKFKKFSLEIIESSIDDPNQHKIAINFFSEPVLWLDTINDFLLVSTQQRHSDIFDTELIQLIPYLNIHSLTFKDHDQANSR